jgi:hypothetical protein
MHQYITMFKKGRENIAGEERFRRPSSSTTENTSVLVMILDIRRVNIEEEAHHSWLCSWSHPKPTWDSESLRKLGSQNNS